MPFMLKKIATASLRASVVASCTLTSVAFFMDENSRSSASLHNASFPHFREIGSSIKQLGGDLARASSALSTSSLSYCSDDEKPKKKNYLPQLYIYDHCPFCVRARMIFGLKSIKHNLVFMSSDDWDTPEGLVGKKVAPILEIKHEDGKDEVMPESMDIVWRIDNDPKYGQPLLKGKPELREDLAQWMKDTRDLFRRALHTRHVMVPLPEFQFRSAREVFIQRHPLAEPSDYNENYYNSALVEEMNQKLLELDAMIFSPECCTDGGLSYDDIAVFGKLRSVTLIRGIKIPPKMKAYIESMSERTDIPLYYHMAL